MMRPKRNTLPRSSFDLSGHDAFTMSPGMLLPVFCKELNPHDHIEIKPQSFVRLQPLQTSAFVRMKQNIEYYFVPMSALYSYWNAFITGPPYNNVGDSSTLLNALKVSHADGALTNLPALNSSGLWSYLFYRASSNTKFVAKTTDFGFNWCNDAARLMDLLGYGYGWYDGASGNNATHFLPTTINPFRLAAYQKIYTDFYRNGDYEDPDLKACNLDWLSADSGSGTTHLVNSTESAEEIRPLFTLRYRNWKKDFGTNVIPTLLYDKVRQTVNNFIGAQPFYGDDASMYVSERDDRNTISLYDASIDYSANDPTENVLTTMFANINTASIRNAFALEKLLETTRLAGKNYDAQIRAHYGFSSPNDKMDSTRYLGGVDAPILINEVVASATTSNGDNTLSSLGEIAGKGISSADGSISFDAPTFGIVMGIMSIVPEADYSASCIDRFNQKFQREDYFQPEFDRLGYQPLYLREVTGAKTSQNGATTFGGVAIGWQPRYNEYKTGKDLIHFGFEANSMSSWCSVRKIPDQLDSHMTQFLKISPSCLDDIFAVNYGGGVSTDKFLVNMVTNCYCVRDMSETGQFSI